MGTDLIRAPLVEDNEVVLTVQDRSGREIMRAAVDRAKQVGELARELAELSGQPPGNYSLYAGGERLEPGQSVAESLQDRTEADVRLVGDLTGN